MISDLGGAGEATSPSSWNDRWPPTGASTMGLGYFTPRISTDHVDLADVDQPTRTQLKFQEALTIGAQRYFVIDTGGHVAEMRRRNVGAADRLEIEDVDRLLGRLDQFGGAHRRPHQRIGQLGPGYRAFAGEGFEPAGGEQRTSGQELQELATVGGLIGKRRHRGPSLKSSGPALQLFRLE